MQLRFNGLQYFDVCDNDIAIKHNTVALINISRQYKSKFVIHILIDHTLYNNSHVSYL